MQSLKFTQFAHLGPNTQGLPAHLAKKLEQAIVDSANKQSKDLKKSYEDKLQRAAQLREEHLSQKTVKVLLHNDKVRVVKQRIDMLPEEEKALKKQIHDTKMQIAELRAVQHRQRALLKAQEMGTKKVQKAQKKREILAAEFEQRLNSKVKETSNKGVFKVKLVYEIKEKNMKRNYEIMKNLTRKRFQSVNERKQKAQSLNEKLQKADERRQLIIQKKIEKAKDLAVGNSVIPESKTQSFVMPNSFDEESLLPLLNVQKMPINPQSKTTTDPTVCEGDSDFEIVDDVDSVLKEKLQRKQIRASEAYRSNLEAVILKARQAYTKFGPTEAQRKQILEKRNKSQETKCPWVPFKVNRPTKEDLENKLNRVAYAHRVNLERIRQKARESSTKYGPSEARRKQILALRKARFVKSCFKKSAGVQFFIRSDVETQGSDHMSSFVQEDCISSDSPVYRSASLKNVKSKKNSVAFEITRDVLTCQKKDQGCQTQRKVNDVTFADK